VDERVREHANRAQFQTHESRQGTGKVLASATHCQVLQHGGKHEVRKPKPEKLGDVDPDPLEERAFSRGDIVGEVALRRGKKSDEYENQQRAEQLEPRDEGE
jgi:hypothetical protein